MWIKNLRQRKLQTVLIFLITAICTTLLSGAMSILTSLDQPSKDFAAETNAASAKVFPYLTDPVEIHQMGTQFSELDSVKAVEYCVTHTVDESIYLNGEKVEIFGYLTEYNDKIYSSAYYLEGNKSVVATLKEDECILPACLSTAYDIHIGDTVTLQLAQGDLTYRVAAVFSNPYQTSTAFDCDILVKKLPEVSTNTNIYVYGKDKVTGRQIEEDYREKYNGKLNGFVYSLEERTNNGLIVGQIIGALFLAIGGIMLLVSGLMIYYMIKNVLITDAKSIATYKTLGYTSKDILFMYLKLYFTIITCACAVGIVGSVFVSNTILTSVFENMGQLQADNSFLSGILCYVVINSFIITIITVIIQKSRKIMPVHALNGADYGGVKKKRRYKGNSALQFSALGIAFRTFLRDKRNAVGIIITCIITVFSVNFIVISLDVANSMKENNDVWIGVDKSDVMINITNPTEYEAVNQLIGEDPRINHYYDCNYQAKVTLQWVKGMTTTYMNAFVFDDFAVVNLPVTEGRNPSNADEIAISTSVAEEMHKSVGDYFEVYLEEDKKAYLLITGLFQSYMQFGRVCRLTTAAYREHGVEFNYSSISIYLKNGSDTNEFMEDMKDKLGGKGNVIKRTDQFGSVMDMITKPQQRAIPPVAALIFIIAGLNIFGIVYLKNLKSQKINGVYKCLGYTTWHLIFSNLYYVTAIAVFILIFTLPVSMLTYAPIMKLSLSMFHFMQYPMTFQISHLVIANLAVIVVFILSTLASSKALFKVNARDLVQE